MCFGIILPKAMLISQGILVSSSESLHDGLFLVFLLEVIGGGGGCVIDPLILGWLDIISIDGSNYEIYEQESSLRNFYWRTLWNSNKWLWLNRNSPCANVSVSSIGLAFGFHFVFLFDARDQLCQTTPVTVASTQLSLLVNAAFLWLPPLLSSSSQCLLPLPPLPCQGICNCFPSAFAIDIMLLPSSLSQLLSRQPLTWAGVRKSQISNKILNGKNRSNLPYF